MFYWEFKTKKEKWASWYTTAIIVALAFILWWAVTWMYAMSVVVFIMAWVYMLNENNSPDVMQIEINENWIAVWEVFYDYAKIEAFSIIYSKKTPIFLRLRLNARWFRFMDIPLEWVDWVSDVRTFLLWYVSEDSKWELWTIDKLVNYLKL